MPFAAILIANTAMPYYSKAVRCWRQAVARGPWHIPSLLVRVTTPQYIALDGITFFLLACSITNLEWYSVFHRILSSKK